MNLSEAYQLLDLPQDANVDQLKKQFKKLSLKNHPDVNKEPGAEDKYKKISQAYNLINEHLENPNKNFNFNSGSPFNPFENMGGFNPFDFSSFVNFSGGPQNMFHHVDPIMCDVYLSFKESILGTSKNLSFDRLTKCQKCSGLGKTFTTNKCEKCNGKGHSVSVDKSRNATFVMNCSSCSGTGKAEIPCSCDGGRINTYTNFDVKVPGGVSNDSIIRLRGGGHFDGRGYHDTLVRIHVEEDPDMKLVDNNVISTVRLSLLEALQGTKKQVKTVLGEEELIIPAKSKNNEQVILPKRGVDKNGDHIFTLDVDYPENKIDQIISLLKE